MNIYFTRRNFLSNKSSIITWETLKRLNLNRQTKVIDNNYEKEKRNQRRLLRFQLEIDFVAENGDQCQLVNKFHFPFEFTQ